MIDIAQDSIKQWPRVPFLNPFPIPYSKHIELRLGEIHVEMH